ncbi:hypothetical protein FF011L_22130 [Roseimaritima multifibrata]|uniref:Cytochrome c-552/4 domain-containing protein n=1 Tax=Roseimaritima multifibrata TaxID=1930274 RepID=A0A517MEY1_9BACT|nr:multiheme c-type cytochrome [Roseimaritima multifibrata]QDS93443.1 hypothetical protein FF011L_22130 [Roseimaritima multifibrata]
MDVLYDRHRIAQLILWIGCLTQVAAYGQAPSGYQFQGMGRPASDIGRPATADIPPISPEWLKQLPPGCLDTWQADPPAANSQANSSYGRLQIPRVANQRTTQQTPLQSAQLSQSFPYRQRHQTAVPAVNNQSWGQGTITPPAYMRAGGRSSTVGHAKPNPFNSENPGNLTPEPTNQPSQTRNIQSNQYFSRPEALFEPEHSGGADLLEDELSAMAPNRSSNPAPADDLLGGNLLGDDDLLDGDDLLGDDVLGDDLLGGDNLLDGDDLLGGSNAPASPSWQEDDLLGDDSLLDDESLLDGPDPLSNMSGGANPHASASPSRLPNPHASATGTPAGKPLTPKGDASILSPESNVDPHAALLAETRYPSARTCAECHPKHFEEWRVSAHAYSMLSPMYQRFEQTMTDLTQGTVGTFCARCHSPVATQESFSRAVSALEAPEIVREGITCIACHRVNEAYGRTNGRRRIEPGDIFAPVYGGGNGSGIAKAISDRKQLKLKTDPSDKGPGQAIHTEGRFFEPITRSDFCATCHQVAVHPGIGLEVVHAQYRAGPAAAKGISCQDCHMGAVPGKAEGYEECHIAELSGKPWGEVRKHANHSFWGPNYSIAHPGIYPISKVADRWTPRDWLAFDYYSDWGKDKFERNAAKGQTFPKPWDNTDDRRDARKIIDANMKSLDRKRQSAVQVLESALKIDGPFFSNPPTAQSDLAFYFDVTNVSEGHNLSTGSLGAQPQVWMNVALINPEGMRVWESGYLDSNGDLADVQSYDVATGQLPADTQLFNLQTKFLINSFRGTDREVALPLNFNVDQLVFLRPGAVPVSLLNHPPGIRMEAHSLPPLGSRKARYRIPAEHLSQPGFYRLAVRFRSKPEPSYLMRLVGATPDMIRRMNEGILTLHPQSHTIHVR